MSIYRVLVISRAGSLVFDYEPKGENRDVERTFDYPMSVVLEEIDQKATVVFGERDSLRLRYVVSALNGHKVEGIRASIGGEDGEKRNVFEYLEEQENYPVTIKFSPPSLSTNEKIILASMFHSIFTIAVQLSPINNSSGIEVLETSQFRLCCLQSRTGVKFVLILSPNSGAAVETILSKLYEIYADYVMKNPFHTMDMPIRCHKFEENLKALLDKHDKTSGAMAV